MLVETTAIGEVSMQSRPAGRSAATVVRRRRDARRGAGEGSLLMGTRCHVEYYVTAMSLYLWGPFSQLRPLALSHGPLATKHAV